MANSLERDPSASMGRNIEPFLLLELLHGSSYGYDLIRKLADDGFRRASAPPVVYKVLRSLEQSGSIRSRWTTQKSGPARRYYAITEQGRLCLRGRLYYLKRHLGRMERLLERYAGMTGDALETESLPRKSSGRKSTASVRLSERM